MYKLEANKIKISFFILILGLASSYLVYNFLQTHSIILALPMLLIGGITFYLIINLVMYSKARTNFVLLLSVINLLIFFLLLFIPYIIINKSFLIDSNLVIELNYIAATLAYLFSVAISKISITQKSQTEISIQEIISSGGETDDSDTTTTQAINPTIEQESTPKTIERSEHITPPAAKPEEVKKEKIVEISDTNEAANDEPAEEPTAESIYGTVDEEIPKQAVKQDEFLKESTETKKNANLLEEVPLAPLEELPDLELGDNQNSQSKIVQEKPVATPPTPQQQQSTESDGMVKVYEFEDYSDEEEEESDGLKISGNIRVVEVEDEEEEAQGSIASIAKLLVNQRDVENVIQINEIMQQIGCDTGNTKVVSMNKGIEIYESFNKLKVDYPQIKDMAIVEQNGFIIASYFENKRKEQTCCALGSGIYLIVQNYLAQLGLFPQRIFFVFEDQTISINKLNDQIFYLSFANDLNILNFNQSEIFMNKQSITESDYPSMQQTHGLTRAILTSNNKTVVNIYNEENVKKYITVSTAIYDNLRVFLMNILKGTLKHIILSCDKETLAISKKEQQLLILGFAPESTVKISNTINEIENLISKD